MTRGGRLDRILTDMSTLPVWPTAWPEPRRIATLAFHKQACNHSVDRPKVKDAARSEAFRAEQRGVMALLCAVHTPRLDIHP